MAYAELDRLKAPLASPNFTGLPTAPTAEEGTSNTQIATTKFVTNEINRSSKTTSGIVTVQKLGKLRIVDVSGTVTAQNIATVDAPISVAHAVGRWKNTSNVYYPALVTLSAGGGISASYFNGTTVSAITNGTIVFTLVYIAA